MTHIKFFRFSVWLFLALLLSAAPLAKPVQAAPADEKITLDFKDVELTELINTISELTGKNFLYDDSIKGKVTIVSPETMTLDETYQLFLTVLNVKGYTLVPSGKVNKIVSTKTARQEGLPVYTKGRSDSDQFITRLVRLNYLDVDTVATSVLAPLMPATGNIITYPPTNTLILTETASTIDRMVKIMQQLDQPDSSGELTVLPLRYADAEEVAKICQEIVTEQAGATQRRANQKISTTKEGTSKIIAYPRTNSLIVVSSSEDLDKIKGLLATLDQEPREEEADINVYYLENADAETLATTLNEILTGVKAAAASAAATANKNQAPTQSSAVISQQVSITADKPTNSLIINAQQKDYTAIKSIIKKLDIKRKQVYVEALIIELSMDATKDLGASLSGAIDLGNDGVIFAGTGEQTSLGNLSSSTSLLSTAINGVLVGGMFNPITVTAGDGKTYTVPALSALLNLSKTDSDVNVLSAPRLLTSDNEEAEIIVGDNVPIVTEKITDSTNTDNVTVSVERQDAALTLRFTPQVIEDNLVRLNIYQEITGVVEGSDSNTNGPTLTKRVIRNTVLAQSKKTLILGGLINNQSTQSETKVPLLGDIPVLGWLFKTRSTSANKKNLLVFITPTIIKDTDDIAQVTNANRLKAATMLTEEQRTNLPEDFKQLQDEERRQERPQQESN